MGGGGGGLGGIVSGALTGGALGMVTGVPGLDIAGGVAGGAGMGMPDLSQMLGVKNGFSATGVPLQMPTTDQMAKDQYGNVTHSLDQQQKFVDALQSQNGIGNQNAAFQNAQNMANGVGPNPAQAMLANSTGANVANQAAMMAGQRGANVNPALMARQASMQGANLQQQAAGQGAAMQAQQQVQGQQNMANIAGQQVANQAQGISQLGAQAQNAYGQVSGNINNQNNTAVNQQAGINAANAGVAAGNAKNNAGMVGGVMNMVGGFLGGGKAHGGLIEPQYAEGGIVDTVVNTIKNAFEEQPKGPVRPAPTPDPQKAKDFAKGMDRGYAEGGIIPNLTLGVAQSRMAQTALNPVQQMPEDKDEGIGDTGKSLGKGLKKSGIFDSGSSSSSYNPNQESNGQGRPLRMDANGGMVDSMVSPGETYLPPDKVQKVVEGADPLKEGKRVPGKPKVKGDSYTNDTVPAKLEEGGIVIPNSIMQSKHPQWEAHKFVSAILKKQAMAKGK